jgi:hypothetical protein
MKDRVRYTDIFGYERRNALLDAIHATDGTASFDQLKQVVRKAEMKSIEKVGEDSEKKFLKYASHLDNIFFVQNAHPQEDVYKGVDMWIRFKKGEGLPDLPVQVKSSFKDVDAFRENSNYLKRKCLEIVINCGPKVTEENFKIQFRGEIKRIKASITANPSLLNSIKR